nr:hypothetical protein Iba_chr14dCG16780 [Ipomoea batatas]
MRPQDMQQHRPENDDAVSSAEPFMQLNAFSTRKLAKFLAMMRMKMFRDLKQGVLDAIVIDNASDLQLNKTCAILRPIVAMKTNMVDIDGDGSIHRTKSDPNKKLSNSVMYNNSESGSSIPQLAKASLLHHWHGGLIALPDTLAK